MTCTDRITLDAIAGCLAYPHSTSAAEARVAALGLEDIHLEAAQAFEELASWLDGVDIHDAEEVYTNLFDLQPACTLDIGHHVYGEAYQRGALLAGLVQELSAMNIDSGDELPDYLPTVLKMVGRLPDNAERQTFIDRILAVAIGRMKKELKRTPTPWAKAVCALAEVYVAPAEELDDSLHQRIRREVLAGA